MAVSIGSADGYIAQYCVETEDWAEADDDKKLRLINVASRTLTTKYPTYTIPDGATYEMANVLAIMFNDTNKLAMQGITAFTLSGVASFDFKERCVSLPHDDLACLIPQSSRDLIGAENGVKLSKRRVGWSVL